MIMLLQEEPGLLPFERLSVTPEREDTQNTLTQPGRDTDKALPEYQGTDTTDQGAAAMKRTAIVNNGSGITLPGLTRYGILGVCDQSLGLRFVLSGSFHGKELGTDHQHSGSGISSCLK